MMKKIGVSICLLLLATSPAKALEGVGALADQVAIGDEVRISGKTAPWAEVNIVKKGGDSLVAAAEIERTGDFDFRFKLRTETVADLQIFAVDDFGVSSRVDLSAITSTVLMPPTIVNDKNDTSTTAVALAGRTYPNSEVSLSLAGPETGTFNVTADQTGLWLFKKNDLKGGKYTATAISRLAGLVSKPSQEIFFEIQAPSVPVIGKMQHLEFSVWWWLPLILLTLFWPMDLWTLFLRLLYGFLYFFGWHKRRRKWGVVYDSVSKQPIVGALVMLCKITDGRSRVIEMSVTTKDGEFQFMPQEGKYLIKVSKGGYLFPSLLIKGRGSDGEYMNQYHGEEFEIVENQEVMLCIALDRLAYRVSFWFFFQKYLKLAWNTLSWCLLISAAIFAFRIWLSTSWVFDFLIMAIYILLIIWNLSNGIGAHRKRSKVIEMTSGRGVGFASVAVYEAGTQVLVQRRVSDQKGWLVLRLSPGSYRVIVTAVDMVADVAEELLEVRGEGIQDVKMTFKMMKK